MPKIQTWNNILGFIGREIGVKFNQLELTDEEIIEGLKADVLPLFSQYVPLKKQIYISSANRVLDKLPGEDLWVYELPISDDIEIIDIVDAYANETYSSEKYVDPYYDTKFSRSNLRNNTRGSQDYMGLQDFMADQVFYDIVDYLSPRNTWTPIPPNRISWDFEISSAIVVCDTIHKDLSTIYSDLYHMAFKPLCLGKVQLWLSKLRSKFSELSSPIGNIRLNYEKLEQDGKENIEKAMEILRNIPPDHIVEVSV